MKRLLILWLLLPLLSAAKVPVESDIKARIEDPASEQYYPNLRLRYEQADSTLTAEDYHYLYYGYAYQPQYRPLETNPALDRFYETLARLNVDAPADTDLLAVIEAGTEALEADPFSPQVLNFLSFAHAQRGDTAQAAAYRDKMNLVLATIESSGDGLTEETPWHILMYAHAFDLLAAKNIPVRESSIISRTVEYIPRVKKDEKGVKGYYFDYGRIYWKKPEQGYKRERSWQFNNLKPWKNKGPRAGTALRRIRIVRLRALRGRTPRTAHARQGADRLRQSGRRRNGTGRAAHRGRPPLERRFHRERARLPRVGLVGRSRRARTADRNLRDQHGARPAQTGTTDRRARRRLGEPDRRSATASAGCTSDLAHVLLRHRSLLLL